MCMANTCNLYTFLRVSQFPLYMFAVYYIIDGPYIPNGCLDAYEVKVNKDTFKYQAKVK